MIGRRGLLLASGALTALPLSASQAAAAPLRMVVPFTPGGPTDVLARVMAQAMSEVMQGRPVVVDNRPGAGGSIGSDQVARGPADGNTVLVGTVSTQVLNKGLFTNLTYDPVEDFIPVALVGEIPLIGVTYPQFPAANLREFIAQAKANPGRFGYATPGNGTAGHVANVLFCQDAGIDLMHIPFRGTAPGTAEVIGGRVQFTFETIPSGLELIRSGALKALAVASEERLPQLPDVPTFSEAGVPGFISKTWIGLFVAKPTPREVVEQIFATAAAAAKLPAVKQRLEELGIQAPSHEMSLVDLRQYLQKEADRWLPVMAANNMKAD